MFSGVPFMGNFQSALFYPPNWIYLVLPLHSAINSEIVLHVFLLGLCTAAWLKRYEFHPLALLLACTVSMFGAHRSLLHIYAGHLATLDAMAWIPLVLLSLEELLEEPRIGWILVGIFRVLDAVSRRLSPDLLQHPGLLRFVRGLLVCGALLIENKPSSR